MNYKYFRPISLCNMIYKIFIKILNNTIKTLVLKHNVDKNIGFVLEWLIFARFIIELEAIHSIQMVWGIRKHYDTID